MTKIRPLNIVVVDDVVRFALHVWRYFGRGIGFGIGNVSPKSPEETEFFEDSKPKSLPTNDGRAAVWWIPADKNWEKRLRQICDKIQNQDVIFLVDVNSTDLDYEVTSVIKLIRSYPPPRVATEKTIFVVSSYAVRVVGERVWPKSPETLQVIYRSLPRHEPMILDEHSHLHVLVTGAGFEMRARPRDDSSGQRSRVLGVMDETFGLPDTAVILENMSLPVNDGHAIKLRSFTNRSFPTCKGAGFSALNQATRRLKIVARNRKLDEWWDLVLETILQSVVGSLQSVQDRRRAKQKASELETDIRNAFRDGILFHDWGLLRQSLDAARFPWCAWLTTNYTHFADRAIALTKQSRRRRESLTHWTPSWRVISTASEARLLVRQLQDGGDLNMNESQKAFLFKLHGDISHLHTMAIAGQDKDLYSTLSVSVDNLYQVYNAAEQFLAKRLRNKPKVTFHIVGHGLHDAALVNLMNNLYQTRAKDKCNDTEFKIVDPNPGDVRARLQSTLQCPCKVIKCEDHRSAEGYLASLADSLPME